MDPFKLAKKEKIKARVAILGPSGSGKSRSALEIAQAFGKIAAGDTEHKSLNRYADKVTFYAVPIEPPYSPSKVPWLIQNAINHGYDVLVIDSMYHFWKEEGGVLSIVDEAAEKNFKGNKHSGWSVGDPAYREMMQAILRSDIHIICTFRSKQAYEQVKVDGRTKIVKLGMEPMFRDGAEYEFDIILDIDENHVGRITKTRFDELDDTVWEKPGRELGGQILACVGEGEDPAVIERARLVEELEKIEAEIAPAGVPEQLAAWRQFEFNLLCAELAKKDNLDRVGKNPQDRSDWTNDQIKVLRAWYLKLYRAPKFTDAPPEVAGKLRAQLFGLASQLCGDEGDEAYLQNSGFLTYSPTKKRPSLGETRLPRVQMLADELARLHREQQKAEAA